MMLKEAPIPRRECCPCCTSATVLGALPRAFCSRRLAPYGGSFFQPPCSRKTPGARCSREEQAVQLHAVAAQSTTPMLPLSHESPWMQAAGLGRQGQDLGNLAWPPHTGICYSQCAPSTGPPMASRMCCWKATLQSLAYHIPGLLGCFHFLTCSDSSSFMSSFGGNKSLAWMYSKLGGPSSPCIANRAHSQTASASTCCESQKLKLLDIPGTPGAWDLCMEMPVLPPDPSSSSACCRVPTAQ